MEELLDPFGFVEEDFYKAEITEKDMEKAFIKIQCKSN